MVIIMVIIMIIMVIITVILEGRVRCEEVREGGMRVLMGSKTWREGGSCNNIIINSTQKVSSGVLNSQNMVSLARTSSSYFTFVSPVF